MWREMAAWAKKQGWRCESRRLSGRYEGYRFTVTGYDGSRFRVTVPVPGLTDDARARLARFFAANQRYVLRYDLAGGVSTATVRTTFPGLGDRGLAAFAFALSAELKAAGVAGDDHCGVCSVPGEYPAVWLNGVAVVVCPECHQQLSASLEQAARENATTSRNYAVGVAGALLGALVGAVPWVLVGQMGFQASILGWLIGSAAMFGYTRLGGRVGRATAWVVAGATLIGVVAAELTSGAIFFARNDYAISLDNYRIMYTAPGVAGASWSTLLIGLAMAGLGVWRIIMNLAKQANDTSSSLTAVE